MTQHSKATNFWPFKKLGPKWMIFYSLGTGARGLLPLGLLGFPSGSLVFWWPWLLMHIVRLHHSHYTVNYTHYTLQVERFIFQRIEISMIMELRILFFRLVSVPKGREVWALGWPLGFQLLTNPPKRQEPIMAGPAGLSKRSVGLRLSDE